MKHFTVIELGDDNESPMIGTINNVTEDERGTENFKKRAMKALEGHFDTDDIHFKDPFPDLFAGSAFDDMEIEIDDVKYEIRILETWIY